MIFFCSRVWLYLFHASRECLLAAGHGEPSERGHERLVLGSNVEADLVAGADELYGRVRRQWWVRMLEVRVEGASGRARVVDGCGGRCM